jgi:hypothetical protein
VLELQVPGIGFAAGIEVVVTVVKGHMSRPRKRLLLTRFGLYESQIALTSILTLAVNLYLHKIKIAVLLSVSLFVLLTAANYLLSRTKRWGEPGKEELNKVISYYESLPPEKRPAGRSWAIRKLRHLLKIRSGGV